MEEIKGNNTKGEAADNRRQYNKREQLQEKDSGNNHKGNSTLNDREWIMKFDVLYNGSN